MPAGPDFRHTNFSDGRGCPHFTYTHFFGLPSHLHFTYTNFSGGRGFCILPIHTFDHAARPFLKKSNEIHKKSVLYIENVFALRAPFY